jgi:hypothetical protein
MEEARSIRTEPGLHTAVFTALASVPLTASAPSPSSASSPACGTGRHGRELSAGRLRRWGVANLPKTGPQGDTTLRERQMPLTLRPRLSGFILNALVFWLEGGQCFITSLW